MILPNSKIEKEIIKNNGVAIGVDEAGRGPLAGPVVSAAAWVNPKIFKKEFELKNLIRDSKKLSEKQREKVYQYIAKSDDFLVSAKSISHKTIDKINILNASLLSMRLAVEELSEKIKTGKKIYVLLDGNKKVPNLDFDQRLFVKGDQNVFSISLASICAKVYRDRLMNGYHKKYPQYGFDRHRGYGTKLHFENLSKNGPCKIHRKSFNLGL